MLVLLTKFMKKIKEKINLEDFSKLKEKIRLIYKEIGSVYSPALKSNIVFNSDGFHHLSYDGSRKERNKRVQKNKFMFLKDGVEVLKKSTTIQEYRRLIYPIGKKDKNGLRKTALIEWFGFFSIINFSRKIRIKVIVRRVGEDKGKYHFWSIMPFWALSKDIRIIGSKEIEDK